VRNERADWIGGWNRNHFCPSFCRMDSGGKAI
jgi:hypothetical protein